VEGSVKKRHPAVSIPEIWSSGAGPSGPIELKPLDFPIEVRVLKNEMGLAGTKMVEFVSRQDLTDRDVVH